jgi:hypothetical protein
MHESSVDHRLQYGKALASSCINGLRRGKDSYLKGQPLPKMLRQSARSSLAMAAIGFSAGLLQLGFGARRRRIPRGIVVGTIGAGLGFCAAFTWKTRLLAHSMAHGAAKDIGVARDEHWLARNPIDYA